MPSCPPSRGTAPAWLSAVLAFALPACQGNPDDRIPVFPAAGKVTYRDKPLADALVVFQRADAPADPSKTAPNPTSRTTAEGTFRLGTYEPDDGAPAGRYLVGVSTARASSGESGPLAKRAGAPDVLKGRYADPRTSGLTAEIKEGANQLPAFALGLDAPAGSQTSVPHPNR